MSAESGYQNQDEWELVNDDGFVYRRKKRLRTKPAAPPPLDPTVERQHRRERRKRVLLKLRERYSREVSWWELLSNMLKEMELNAQTQLLEGQELCHSTPLEGAWSSDQSSTSDFTLRRFVDGLTSQVEAQEAIIQNVSNLCDLAKALCNAREERLKHQLTDLPIWDRLPHELMAALGDQYACFRNM